LIDFAASKVDQLFVVVCDRSSQTIPGNLRAKWLKEIHPKTKVLVVNDIEKDDDSLAWAKYTKKFLGFTPNFVFTSEDYGHDYCRHMGSIHILVDKKRVHVPISATKVRSNPYKYWQYLEPCVRAHFAKRVCVVGAESTGTTTMAHSLAQKLKTSWVQEYGRFYSEGRLYEPENSKWDTTEFSHIAHMQNQFEDALAKRANKLLICDTNSFATAIWHERYLGHQDKQVNHKSKNRHYDLYLITADDIPFVQDGTRDGEHIRHWMHKKFISELKKHDQKYIVLKGTHRQRLQTALSSCQRLIADQKTAPS